MQRDEMPEQLEANVLREILEVIRVERNRHVKILLANLGSVNFVEDNYGIKVRETEFGLLRTKLCELLIQPINTVKFAEVIGKMRDQKNMMIPEAGTRLITDAVTEVILTVKNQ